MVAARSMTGLRQIALFSKLSAQRLDLLAQQCAWQNLPARVVLVMNAEKRNDVYFVVSGWLRIMGYATNGRQIIFRDCRQGEYFGEMAAIDDHARSADVVTLQPSLVASLDGANFRQLLRDEPMVAEGVMMGLVRSVRQLSERLMDLSSTHVVQRVNLELLRMADTVDVTSDRVVISPAPTHAEMAARIGTTREEVTRALGALKALGWLKSSGRTLILLNVEAFRRKTLGH